MSGSVHTILIVLTAFLVSTASAAPGGTFGKSYEAGALQKWIVAQAGDKTSPPGQVPPATIPPEAMPPAGGLDLDKPQLEPAPAAGASVGPFQNLNFGGALDMRVYFPRPGGATDAEMAPGMLDIHVSELFLTTNIGDNISILAEQLLVTGKMGDTIGQDHGFVYAIFSNLPLLPESVALKMGRLRHRFGIDAKSDSAANVLRSPVYSTLGWITDKGLELSGYVGPFDWSIGVMNGADTVTQEIDTMGGGMAEIDVEIRNGSKPVLGRVGFDVTDWAAVGVSAFTGNVYPVYSDYGLSMHDMIFNAHLDTSRLVYKNRYAADLALKLGPRWALSGEYAWGLDRENGESFDVRSAFGRLDYRIIPQKLNLQVQYTAFDDGRHAGHVPARDTGHFGVGLAYSITDQATVRGAFQFDDRGLLRKKRGEPDAPEYLGTVQTLLSF